MIASEIVTESDSCLVIGFVIVSVIATESDSGFVTDFVIASVIVTESDNEISFTADVTI